MSKRKFGSIKSLLHFDYPYFNEPNDGLGDEIGLETWTNSGATLRGSVIPKAGTYAPKFGYRCLYTKNTCILGNNDTGIWNMDSDKQYEVGMFINAIQIKYAQNILSLMDTEQTNVVLQLSINAGGALYLEASGFGVSSTSGNTIITIKSWHHILMRVSGNKVRVFLNGKLELSASLPSNTVLSVGEVKLGNYATNYELYIDEFMFRHAAGIGRPRIPSAPYNGALDVFSIGGYGTGVDGNKEVTTNTVLNTCGTISSISDGTSLIVSTTGEGDCNFAIGSEVMIHITAPLATKVAEYPYVGFYEFRHITGINTLEEDESSNVIVLDKSIEENNGDSFTLDNNILETYKVQIISVPNYQTLTVNKGINVTPTNGSGIVVFRCTGDCTIEGKILTSGYGVIRYDMIQMTHSQMADRFMITQGGGIYIVCGGTLRLGDAARLGASWSGRGENYNGAAGYGGNCVSYNNQGLIKWNGGVGGGAGGVGGNCATTSTVADNNTVSGGAVGAQGTEGTLGSFAPGGGGGCGGQGGPLGNKIYGSTNEYRYAGSGGGCQGEVGGHRGIVTRSVVSTDKGLYANGKDSYGCNGGHGIKVNGGYLAGAGDGGAGGSGGNGYTSRGGYAGSCIVIVSNKARLPETSISTGGEKGTEQIKMRKSDFTGGAGGTGFCYMAIGELIDE